MFLNELGNCQFHLARLVSLGPGSESQQLGTVDCNTCQHVCVLFMSAEAVTFLYSELNIARGSASLQVPLYMPFATEHVCTCMAGCRLLLEEARWRKVQRLQWRLVLVLCC